jgi:FixJ family two-component response regulator
MRDVPELKDCVGIIDDDAGVRRVLVRMLASLNIDVREYASPREYLTDASGREACLCLVLDVRLPGMSGLDLHKLLVLDGNAPSVVFISGYADVPMAVEAMQHGAVDFLTKPVKEQQLLDVVQRALGVERLRAADKEGTIQTAKRRSSLTPREHDVLSALLRGLRTKEIAGELGIATKTAEEHRSHVMHKMGANSIADLVRMCNAAR